MLKIGLTISMWLYLYRRHISDSCVDSWLGRSRCFTCCSSSVYF